MKFELAHYVQREHHFAIVDEVDSILIDEARTPLIISGPAEESTDLYYEVDRIIPRLKAGAVIRGDTKAEEREALEATGDYIVDEKHKTVTLTESGMAKAEQMLAAPAERRATSTISRTCRTSSTTSIRRCARTRSSSATSTTWSRTARSSSSTSSPAA